MREQRDRLDPLWYSTATPREADVPCTDGAALANLHADAIVLGAGVIGCSAALHLAARGAKVAIIERDSPGAGSTGAANGQILAGLQQDPDALLAAYGDEVGERLIAFSGAAPQLVFDLIERHGIECGAERNGWIQASRSRHAMKAVEKRAESWAKRGAPIEIIDRARTVQLLGTKRYIGGFIDRRNGVVQPLDYVRGLAAAAVAHGAQLFCGVHAKALRHGPHAWFVDTALGTATAKTIVVATNVLTTKLEGPGLDAAARSYLPAYSVQIATEPLRASVRESLLPERHCASDASHVHLRYFRYDRENRFIMGGPGWLRAPKSATALSFRRLEASTRRMFPQLAGIAFVHRWAARDAFTADLLPHLVEPDRGVFAALGCNGRGLAIGTALGSVLARRVLGESPASLPFPTTDIGAIPLSLASSAKLHLRVVGDRIRCLIA